MLPGHQESSSRKLVYVEGRSFARLGCSECAWVFTSSGPPVGNSFDEITRNLQVQLDAEFAAHFCAEHPQAKESDDVAS